uniref:Putative ovule protein n=1 Tax=Solanum chacoense TaxID=4108 RepID=A0A0V0HAI0_SOLCH
MIVFYGFSIGTSVHTEYLHSLRIHLFGLCKLQYKFCIQCCTSLACLQHIYLLNIFFGAKVLF